MDELVGGYSVAQVPTVSFQKVLDGDDDELAKLLDVFATRGFMYLDLLEWRQGETAKMLHELHAILEEWFKQPVEEKSKATALSDAHGYKEVGQQAGVLEGKRDGFESFRINRLYLSGGCDLPDVIEQHFDLFDKFYNNCHTVLMTLLQRLSDLCQLDETSRFERMHIEGQSSRSSIDFIHHPPTPNNGGMGHNIHTDLGLLTLLFNREWGLQVVSPTTDAWEYVAPRHGCPMVNVGDTLMFASQQRFKSALHRVYPIGGAMTEDRYSTAYFLRPTEDIRFETMDGKIFSSEDWFTSKFDSFKIPLEEARKTGLAWGGLHQNLKLAL